MPGTASSQIQSRSNTKARPSANVRAANLVANTPVLFRLPAIPTIPNAATQDLAVSYSESAANLPTATLAAVTLSSAQPTAQAIEVSDLPQAAPQRTWWEHWSSGIVLIVLLIALATASILAWQGSNKGNSKLMADTKGDIVSQSDLSAIEVPRLEVPRLDLPISTNSDSHADKQEISSVQNGSKRKSGDEMDTSLIPSGRLSFDPTPIAEKSEPVAEIAEPESHATASLKSPVGKPQEPLFPDEALSKPNISAQPASTSTHRNAEKPSIWDSSNANVHDTNKPLTLELSPTSSSSAANSATPASEPSNETLSSISASLISQPMAETPGISLTSSVTTLVPKDMQFAARTSTPEMDQSALLASYLQFAQTQAPPPAKPDNRYQSVATAGSQNGSAAVSQQPNTQPAPSNNYTLQPAQNYLPNAQPQPNPTSQYQYQQYTAPQSQNLPQYGSQNQAGMQSQSSSQNQVSNNRLGPQYAGAQVPYPGQPASQPSALQLPPGPIGGNGLGVSPPGTPFSTSSSTMLNPPNGGTANGTTNSPNYPSLR